MGSNPTPRTNSLIHHSLAEFAFHLKREGYRPSTIESYIKGLKTLAKMCNLNDPESVKDAIATREVSDARKGLLVSFYKQYADWKYLDFKAPRYRRIEKLPFVPLESEIDQLIGGFGKSARALSLPKHS